LNFLWLLSFFQEKESNNAINRTDKFHESLKSAKAKKLVREINSTKR
jgi:hypothetical protein